MPRPALVLATLLASATTAPPSDEVAAYLKDHSTQSGVVTLKSGLQYKVIKSGAADGKSPQVSSPCVCHYTGSLIDGTVFDSSVKRGKPATFAPNQVIRGWT